MKKTENCYFKSKFTLMKTNVCNQKQTYRLINKDGDKFDEIPNKNSKIILNSSIIDRSYIYNDDKEKSFNGYQSTNTIPSTNSDESNKILVNSNIQGAEVILKKNESILNNCENFFETYVPEKYGLNHNNTFVMSFCKPSLYDYFKCLIGLNSYEYEDYIQYKLHKKSYSKQDILLNTIIVEKNAFHCQGLVKKIIVMKNYNSVPKKIIFV